jgi:hypothetical protein
MEGHGNGIRNGYEQGANDRYVWRYILLLKSFTVYGLDIFVAVTMISSEHVRLSSSFPFLSSFSSFCSSRTLLLSEELTHIANTQWTTTIARKCGDDCAVPVRFDIAKWIFVGCIIFSFLLVSLLPIYFLDLAYTPFGYRKMVGNGERIDMGLS